MRDAEASDPVAALHHLTGASRGGTSWLQLDRHELGLAPNGVVHLTTRTDAPGLKRLARFECVDGAYKVSAAEGSDLWVNRKPVREAQLKHGDTLEFGEDGPISRFELVDDAHPLRRTVPDILDDAVAYVRSSRRPVGRRMAVALSGTFEQLLRQTTWFFRISVFVAIAAIIAVVVQLGRELEQLGESVVSGEARLDAISAALKATEEKALKPSDLALLREEIGSQLQSSVERLEDLEDRWQAGTRVIAAATPSVAFLQGAFVFRDKETGRPLRYVVDEAGARMVTPFGRPFLSLEGDGPIAEREFNGTGILLAGERGVLTNRHVAMPWEHDAASAAALEQGLEPIMARFTAHFPDRPEPVSLRLEKVSERSDLAILATDPELSDRAGLSLSDHQVQIGDPVIVMGYATGIGSMLAQAGRDFVEALNEEPQLNTEGVIMRLASAGLIRPLASRGIVGQVGPEAVVFDADTTHGGSGGPVLSLDGGVIAISSAIIRDYGGSNIGVPAERVRALLEE